MWQAPSSSEGASEQQNLTTEAVNANASLLAPTTCIFAN